MKPEDTRENYEICIRGNCSTCPTYPKGSGEGLYCVRGYSARPIERRGCNCPECPLWTTCGLSEMYYCFKGNSH